MDVFWENAAFGCFDGEDVLEVLKEKTRLGVLKEKTRLTVLKEKKRLGFLMKKT